MSAAGWHADGNGLYLVIESSGAKRWMQRLVIQGRRRVMIGFEGPMSKKEAEKREPQKADELRSEGFDVHGPTMME